jgi:hypothetical protein
MTWARQHAPETQQAIADAYNSVGRELGAVVVPVSSAWQALAESSDQPHLYDRDGSHPSLAGTYLAACVFLAAMLKINPTGIEAGGAGLNNADRELLQRTAWKHGKPRRTPPARE